MVKRFSFLVLSAVLVVSGADGQNRLSRNAASCKDNVKSVGLSLPSHLMQGCKAKMSPTDPVRLEKGMRPLYADYRISGSRRLRSGLVENVYDDGAGHRFKVYGDNTGDALRIQKVPAYSEAELPSTLSESFEGYDGTSSDWIPSDWTEKSAEGNDPLITGANYTWHVTGSQGQYVPTNGQYQAFIQYASVANGDLSAPQDEWLISPEFVPETNSRLYADLTLSLFSIYDPEYFDVSTKTFTKRRVTATLKVMVQADGEWQEIFNARDLASRLSDAELYDEHRGIERQTLRLPLVNFAGKTVKVAFVYTGDNGNSMALDYVAVGTPRLMAVYHRPAGYFFQGMSENYSYYDDYAIMLGPAYTDCRWTALYTRDVESVEWAFSDPDDLDREVTTRETNPVISYPYSISYAPKITARSTGLQDLTYQFDVANEKNGLVRNGGGTEDFENSELTYGGGYYNFGCGIQSPVYSYDANSYCFGPGSNDSFWKNYNRRLVSIASLYEKPATPYWYDRVWVSLRDYDADPDAVFTLNVYEVGDKGINMQPIAVATCKGADVQKYDLGDGSSLYTVPFSFVKDKDGNDSYQLVNSAIMMELTGFMDNPKVRVFAPMTQGSMHVDGENNGYAFYYEDINGKKTYSLASTSYLLQNFYCPFIFTLNPTYSFLFTEDNTYNAPVEGGTKVFSLTSYYYSDEWWIDDDLPEWVSDFTPSSEENPDGTFNLNVSVKPLPAGESGRACHVTLKTWGANQELVITQGDVTGVSAIKEQGVSATQSGNMLMLTYPSAVRKVSIYSVSGREVARVALPDTGSHTVDMTDKPAGCYILRFDNGKTCKIVKD